MKAKVQETSQRSDAGDKFDEIGAGLGPLNGKSWRVGLMGETSSKANVKAFLSALGQILNDSRRKTDMEAALAAGV